MVFSSPTFLFAFLPAVLAAVWLAPARLRRLVIIAASLAFYAWGVQEFLALVVASALVDWALALAIGRFRAQGRDTAARVALIAGLVQNLALLGVYKYAGFVTRTLDHIGDALGTPTPGVVAIALPIGISFFTFEKISYLVDVSRGDVTARRDPLDVLLFVALFPRSIAGPIVRLREIQQDLRTPTPRAEQIQAGATRFAYGLAKKVLIADPLAPVADAAFQTASAGSGQLAFGAAWVGIAAYTLQLYFDFSGYTDMAIGIALMLGFTLPENFRRPYSSVSMTDFWRRWHMTLSRWFRDYVYIPLGGNRGSERATYRNLLIVFGLTGLWHGAAWTFVLWGFYHGAWLLLERRTGMRAVDGPVRFVALRRATTLLIVMMGWVLFRAGDLPTAIHYYRALLTPDGATTGAVATALTHQATLALLIGALVALLPRGDAGGRWVAAARGPAPLVARTAALAVTFPLALVFALSGQFSPFLYFHF